MKSRISKVLGIVLSTGLVFGLIGALFAIPVSADLMDWGIVNTPSWEDMVIVPASDILDYDIGGDGDTIYAVLEVGCDRDPTFDDGCSASDLNWHRLVKSDDGGVTWTDITANVFNAASIPDCDTEALCVLWFVSVAQDDADWLAVVGRTEPSDEIWVVASQDGGDNFTFAGEVDDPAGHELEYVFDIDVSMEIDGIHNIAVAGRDDCGHGAIFRLKAGTWLSGSWEDTGDVTDYLGWNTDVDAVIDCEFSPQFDIDDTIVCLACDVETWRDGGFAVLQSGIWESGGSWNEQAGFPGAKIIDADGESIVTGTYNRNMGLALPDDYDGSDSSSRSIFLYVNGLKWPSAVVGGWVIRSDNYALSPVCGPSGDPLLASIDVHGDADTGKLMIGEFWEWDDSVSGPYGYGEPIDVLRDSSCCDGVSVWHTEELDFCCPQWDGACKDPSGPYLALVMYTPDGEKAYATTSGTVDMHQKRTGEVWPNYDDLVTDPDPDYYTTYHNGTPGDESAFSVSLDDGVSFNQLSLIDTDIDWLSDVAVCPDCSTIYLSTINDGNPPCYSDVCCSGKDWYCGCDSVWRSYDNGDTWERVFHGEWSIEGDDPVLLRLPCDAIEDCCDQDPISPSGTIYLGIWDTDQMFYSRDCGQCWNEPPATKINIQDFAVESENIVYVLDRYGMFSMSTQYGRRWSDAVDTGMDNGHSITSCCDEGFVVAGGYNQPVAWSDDGGESWTLTDDLPIDGEVHVACDPVCENIIYAALDNDSCDGGILRTDITDGSWDNLNPITTSYTGIVVANEGTLYAASECIGVDSDDPCSTKFDCTVCPGYYSGLARNLTPCETACCGTEDWDYLICGLGDPPKGPDEYFNAKPTSLRICGCLSADTNSVLYAIDTQDYDVTDGAGDNDEYGGLWNYEDCAAKNGPILTAPADGAVLDCEPCAGCDAANFTLKWERMCNACSYDIMIMDEDGNLIVEWVDVDIVGDPPSLFIDGTIDSHTFSLECGETYTWKVREANTACECVHSPWSEIWSFTVAVGAADAISLLSPTKGAMDVPIQNVGFSWTGVRDATSYSFVLSPNADLTSALVRQDLSGTAFNYAGPLDYSMAYYWQVIAWKDGTRLITSAIGVFNTMAEPEEPTPPVVVEQQPAPTINIPPTQQITPIWIYAIIGIGCALVVVVIVLIVRTRRP